MNHHHNMPEEFQSQTHRNSPGINPIQNSQSDAPSDIGSETSFAAQQLTRRELITKSTVFGAGAVATTALGVKFAHSTDAATTTTGWQARRAVSASAQRKPLFWSEVYGRRSGHVVIDRPIIMDMDATVDSLEIAAAASLTMDPKQSVTLTSKGNVIVRGDLDMQPASGSRVHRIHFDSVNESRYVGGGFDILDTDVGLWIEGHGVWTGKGKSKAPWTRATSSLRAGATTINVERARGWRIGDEVTITPTGAPSSDNGNMHQDTDSAQTYDTATIVAVSGNTISLDRPLEHSHPMMTFTDWKGVRQNYGAEVLNLTRNVIVSGTDEGKAHVLYLHCHHQQFLSDVQFDRLGPRQSAGLSADGSKERDDGVVGRYPFHMHHCGYGVDGSIMKNLLVTNSGNRAYVPHESHGVTLAGCVAHNVHGTAFWWDQPGRHNPTGEEPETHDSLWIRCVASKVFATPTSENGYRLAGFNLSEGDPFTNKMIRCVAVGVTEERVTQNSAVASGFHWTEHGHGLWKFQGCLAHNIGGVGILGWQNDEEIHPITDFTAYHCSSHGIEHGAYSNFYDYRRMALIGNRFSGIGIHAVTRRTNSVRRRWTDQGLKAPEVIFKNVVIDGQGITTDGIRGLSHRFDADKDGPTIFEDVRVTGVLRAGLYEEKGNRSQYYIFRDFEVDDVEPVMFENGAPPNTVVRINGLNGDGKVKTVTP